MEPIHIFYKELRFNENNIFMANLASKMKQKRSSLKKSIEYAGIGLSINQDVDSDLVAVKDTEKKKQ